jgi:hypothetical protein
MSAARHIDAEQLESVEAARRDDEVELPRFNFLLELFGSSP